MNRAWKTPRTGGVKRTQSTASKHCCTGVPPGQSSNLQDFKFAHVAGKQTWLVVLTILKHMSSSMGRMIPYIMETKMFERILMNAMFKLTTRILVGQTRHLQIPMELLTHNPSVELLKISPGYSEKKRGPTLGS
jgi:hypothetical protein